MSNYWRAKLRCLLLIRRKLRAMGVVVVVLELDKVVVQRPIIVVSYESLISHDVFQKCECVVDLVSSILHVGQRYVENRTRRSEDFDMCSSHV